MNVHFLEPAGIELDDAVSWYEMEQENLGRLFLKEVRSALTRITTFPESCTTIAPGLRRCITKKFPYMLIYGIDDGTVIIVAVANMHREPMYWYDRINLPPDR